MQFVDYLIAEECGGHPAAEWITVEIGDRFEAYYFGEFDSVMTVTEDNKAWIEDALNDRGNDVLELVPVETEGER